MQSGEISSNTTTQAQSAEPFPADGIVFDESVLYQSSSSMTSEDFNERLLIWKTEPIAHASVKTSLSIKFSPESNTRDFCELLSCTDTELTKSNDGKTTLVTLSPFELYQLLVNGLRVMLTTSKSDKTSSKLQETEAKLSAAIFHFIAALHRSIELDAHLPARVFLKNAGRDFQQLFGTLTNLEEHGITIEMVHDIGLTKDAAEYLITLKHITTAILLATNAWTDLEGCHEIVQAEVVRRRRALVDGSLGKFHELDYQRGRECCSKIFCIVSDRQSWYNRSGTAEMLPGGC